MAACASCKHRFIAFAPPRHADENPAIIDFIVALTVAPSVAVFIFCALGYSFSMWVVVFLCKKLIEFGVYPFSPYFRIRNGIMPWIAGLTLFILLCRIGQLSGHIPMHVAASPPKAATVYNGDSQTRQKLLPKRAAHTLPTMKSLLANNAVMFRDVNTNQSQFDTLILAKALTEVGLHIGWMQMEPRTQSQTIDVFVEAEAARRLEGYYRKDRDKYLQSLRASLRPAAFRLAQLKEFNPSIDQEVATENAAAIPEGIAVATPGDQRTVGVIGTFDVSSPLVELD
jgi:hypothetical protein